MGLQVYRMDEMKEQSFANDRHHEDAVKLEFMITAALQDLRQSTDDVSVNKHNECVPVVGLNVIMAGTYSLPLLARTNSPANLSGQMLACT